MDELQTVVANFLSGNDEFFEEHGIDRVTKGEFTLLNYRQDAPPDAFNGWCRALVLDASGRVRSLPFRRFFNRGQKEAPLLDINECHLIEKIDGTLIGVFFHEGRPVYHTRRTISSHESDMGLEIVNFHGKRHPLLQVAKKYVEALNWSRVERRGDWCFAFELVHEATKVVTEYPEDRWGLYILGIRELASMREMSEQEVGGYGSQLRAKDTGDWVVYDYGMVEKLLAEASPDFEGFVARCRKSGHRIKMKNPSYVERHHMIDRRTYRYLIPLWLRGERAEIESYFPDTSGKFDHLDEVLSILTQIVKSRVAFWQARMAEGGWGRKELAQAVIAREEKRFHGYVFGLYDKPWDDGCVRAALMKKVFGLPGRPYAKAAAISPWDLFSGVGGDMSGN